MVILYLKDTLISWKGYSPEANPEFLIGESHRNDSVDGFMRGGLQANLDRRGIDFERIGSFLTSFKGMNFILRQTTLQALNPQPNQRIFNAGVNLLASVLGAGNLNIKRAGIAPVPAGIDTNVFQNPQNIKGVEPRETHFNMGNPGKIPSTSFIDNPFAKKEGYNVSLGTPDSNLKLDKLNFLDIIRGTDGAIPEDLQPYTKDMVKFQFEVIDSQDSTKSNFIVFRAFLDSLNDNFDASHNTIKFNGRAENFYTYNSFNRKVSLSFKIAAQSRHEMKPIYRKLNYLAAQTAPNYSNESNRLITPYMRLTVGDYFNKLPGVLSNVSISWQTNYPWEIKIDPLDKDSEMLVLPHILDVSIRYQPIHSFTPRNDIDVSFIGINKWQSNPITSAEIFTNNNSNLL